MADPIIVVGPVSTVQQVRRFVVVATIVAIAVNLVLGITAQGKLSKVDTLESNQKVLAQMVTSGVELQNKRNDLISYEIRKLKTAVSVAECHRKMDGWFTSEDSCDLMK